MELFCRGLGFMGAWAWAFEHADPSREGNLFVSACERLELECAQGKIIYRARVETQTCPTPAYEAPVAIAITDKHEARH